MTRDIFKQFRKRPHDKDLLAMQGRIGEISGKVFQKFCSICVNISRFIFEGCDNFIYNIVTNRRKKKVGSLEIYCVGSLALLRGTLDWIELAMLSPIDEKKLNIVAVST